MIPAPPPAAFVRFTPQADALSDLRVDPAGKGAFGRVVALRIAPEGWAARPETRIRPLPGGGASTGPLSIWRADYLSVDRAPAATVCVPLTPGHTLGQSFTVPPGRVFGSVRIMLATWRTPGAAALLRLRDPAGAVIAAVRLSRVQDNAWVTLAMPAAGRPGAYRLELAEPVGTVGWWSREADVLPDGAALADGAATAGDRTLLVDAREDVGPGSITWRPRGPALECEARRPARASAPGRATAWRWSAPWTRDGYDCTARSGTAFRRFFSDNQRYMPAEQLKRRSTGGLAFDGARWIRMDGTAGADLRLEAASLHLHWEMEARRMDLRFDTPTALTAGKGGAEWVSRWRVAVLPRTDAPPPLPRFRLPGAALERDVNRFWWERGFTYPAPAQPAPWFEWSALMRGWFAGPAHDGEVAGIRDCPMTAEGYVHTWNESVGWPLVPQPPYDARHFDTNARFILGCRTMAAWSGDLRFLRQQYPRIRRAMAFQLDTLGGRSGLITAVSRDVRGRHGDQGNNYWDILPFGYLDAHANGVFHASLLAMEEIESMLRAPRSDDWRALASLCRRRYDEAFWSEPAGRYIGCIDADGARHDYGFTFVNLEALAHGLGGSSRADRIFRWLETGVTSSGRADAYSRWVFAPRATTLHNPMWGPDAPAAERASATPPWWTSWWPGAPWETQCQDGGAILYTSFFDLLARVRYRGPDDAWRRFAAILSRFRLPDRLCGGAPLFRGEIPQQENPGAVGVDLPFPESGLVPLYLLYGVIGLEARPEGLRIAPSLPRALPWAGVEGVAWRGARLRITVSRRAIRIEGAAPDGRPVRRRFPTAPGRALLLRPSDLRTAHDAG